jgi:MFS family permease
LFTIGTDFRSLSNINWIALAYTLCDLGCAVMFTSMSDVVGRKNAYIVAFILFFSAVHQPTYCTEKYTGYRRIRALLSCYGHVP